MVDIKFCGLTRPTDADYAASLGAAYVGVIFAESPRQLSAPVAMTVVAPARGRARTVGVFGRANAPDVASIAAEVGLDVVQLHGDPAPALVERMRPLFAGEVWAVVRVAGDVIPDSAIALLGVADAVVLDAKVDGRLGGTGTSFDWEGVARSLHGHRSQSRLVLAGGLNPANVASAVRIIAPDVVDVSSGVESAPGVKDHRRMRAFSEAVRGRGSTE